MSKEIDKCKRCGHRGWKFAIVGLTTEIVCEKCGSLLYEKDPQDVFIENKIINELDKISETKGHWKKN